MTRVFKILPTVDDDFHPMLGLIMFIMAVTTITSFFSYRSLVQALLMIYASYIILTFKTRVKNYISKKFNSFNPVLAPYSKKPSVNTSSDDEGYDEDDEDKVILKNHEKIGSSKSPINLTNEFLPIKEDDPPSPNFPANIRQRKNVYSF